MEGRTEGRSACPVPPIPVPQIMITSLSEQKKMVNARGRGDMVIGRIEPRTDFPTFDVHIVLIFYIAVFTDYWFLW